MAVDAIDQEIIAYQHLLPAIRASHGSVWALVADATLVSTFRDFPSAARYADEHYGTRPVLIRHTDEQVETAPFVHVHVET